MFMGFIYKNIDTKYDRHIYIIRTANMICKKCKHIA